MLRKVFSIIARTRSPEVFTATALLVVLGTAWFMQEAGLSPSLGAFLAGVLLSDSEFRHELEAQIEPFKGLLLGLFFIAVGMGIDLDRIAAEPWMIAAGVGILLVVKFSLLYAIGRIARLSPRQSLLLGSVLCCWRRVRSWCSTKRSARTCSAMPTTTGWWRSWACRWRSRRC